MGGGKGVALKFLQWFIRGVQFCCAALILAIFSYFLATLHNHDLEIATWIRAVEGISGAAVVYTAIGLLLLCCLAGFTLTSFLAIALDVAFAGAFIYVASATRGGAGSCEGKVDTAFGSGDADTDVVDKGNGGFTNLPSFHSACKLETACFAVSIVAIFFFILSAVTEWGLARHHQREKRFGPSPQNNYTSGYGKRGLFGWRRNRKNTMGEDANILPEHTHPAEMRDSYATEAGSGDAFIHNKYGEPGHGAGDRLEPASYPAGNYRYDDGVYNTRQI